MTCLELGSDRVLVHVNVVLVDCGHDELIALRLHPRRHERRQIQPRISVKHELVVDDLVRRLLRDRILWHFEPADQKLQIKSERMTKKIEFSGILNLIKNKIKIEREYRILRHFEPDQASIKFEREREREDMVT